MPNEEGERCNFDHVFDNRYYHIVAIYMAVIRAPFLSFYFHREHFKDLQVSKSSSP